MLLTFKLQQNAIMEPIKSGQCFWSFACNKSSSILDVDETVTYKQAKEHFETHAESVNKIIAICVSAINEILDHNVLKNKNMFHVGQLQPELFEEKWNYDLCEWIIEELQKHYNGYNMNCGVEISLREGGSDVYVAYDLTQFQNAGEGVLQIIVL
jgi:hypothetical protein